MLKILIIIKDKIILGNVIIKYQFSDIIQELDFKQRKIRSLRGFLFYVSEIIENEKDYEILSINSQPFFLAKS